MIGIIEPAEVRPQTPALMTASELAAALRLSVRAVWRDLASGRIPTPLKIGCATRWRAQKIEVWISAGCPPRVKWEWPRERQRS